MRAIALSSSIPRSAPGSAACSTPRISATFARTSDDDLFAIDVDGARLLVLSAHGDPFSMHFAGAKSRTLDASDRARLKAFLDRLAPDATIVLQSCSTGRGFAHLVKEAAGPHRTVIAARGIIPRDGLEITSVDPFDVTIRCADGRKQWDCTVRLGG